MCAYWQPTPTSHKIAQQSTFARDRNKVCSDSSLFWRGELRWIKLRWRWCRNISQHRKEKHSTTNRRVRKTTFFAGDRNVAVQLCFAIAQVTIRRQPSNYESFPSRKCWCLSRQWRTTEMQQSSEEWGVKITHNTSNNQPSFTMHGTIIRVLK